MGSWKLPRRTVRHGQGLDNAIWRPGRLIQFRAGIPAPRPRRLGSSFMSPEQQRLIIFTRYPTPGRTKTRLIPLLGERGAAALARRLTLRAVRTARALEPRAHHQLEIRYAGGNERSMQHWLGSTPFLREQGPGDLGQRMARAFEDSFREGATRTLIIGSDCPALHPALLEQAFGGLARHPVVLGPATDGGYYLIGLNKPVPELFAGVDWGQPTVMNRSLEILKRLDLTPQLLQTLDDLDRPDDVRQWQETIAAEESDLTRVSVIIPTLNEVASIEATLRTAQQGEPEVIIVADGGSQDGSAERARQLGARLVESQRGRAAQMNAGASVAGGNTLLFLHGDTLLPGGWRDAMVNALTEPGVAAGAFGFSVQGSFPGKGVVEMTTNLRSRWLQAPYGDQGLFLQRAYFEELGGFADMPIMEDYEIIRRLRGYGRIVTLRERIQTSARRWQERGWLNNTGMNHCIIAGYHLGVPLARLERWYRRNPNPWQATEP